MKRTTVTCDHCGAPITNRSWTIQIAESHGIHVGTMGRERENAFDLCWPCGDGIVRQIQALIEPPLVHESQENPPS